MQLQHLPRERGDRALLHLSKRSLGGFYAARVLVTANGFKRVRPLFGGLDAWVAAGHPAEAITIGTATVVLSTERT